MKGGANPLNFLEFKRKIISENPVYRQTDEWWEYLEQNVSYYAFDEEQRRIQENAPSIVNTETRQGTNVMIPDEGFDNLDLLFVLGAIISKSYIERKTESMSQDALLNIKSVNRLSIGLNSTPRQFVEFVESLIESLKGIKEFGFWMNASRNEDLKEIVNNWYSGYLNGISTNLRRMFRLWPQSLLVTVLNLEEFVDVAYTNLFPGAKETHGRPRVSKLPPSVLEPLDEQLVTVNDDILDQEYVKLLQDIDDEIEIYNDPEMGESVNDAQENYLQEIEEQIQKNDEKIKQIVDKYKTYRARGDDDTDVPEFVFNLTKDYKSLNVYIMDRTLYDTLFHHLKYDYNMDKSIQTGYYMMLTILIEFRTALTDVEWEHRARILLKNILNAIEIQIRWIKRFLQPAPGNIPRTTMPLLGENLREYEIQDSSLHRQDSRSFIESIKQRILDADKYLDVFKKKLERLNVVRASVEEMQKNQIGDDVTNPDYEYDFDELSVLPKSELIKIIQEDDYYHNLDILDGDPIGPDPSIEDIADYLISLKDDMGDNQYGPGEDHDLEKIRGNKKNLGLILIIESTIDDINDRVEQYEGGLSSVDIEAVRSAKHTLQMMARRRRSRFQKPNGIFYQILDNTIESIKEFETSKTISINLLQRFEQHFREGLPTNALQREYEMYKRNDFENLRPEQLEELQTLNDEERGMYNLETTAVPGKPSQTVERRLYDQFNKRNEGQRLNVERKLNPDLVQKMRELEQQKRNPAKTGRQIRWLQREGVDKKTPFDNKTRKQRYLTLKNKPVNPRLSAINRQIQSRQQPDPDESSLIAERVDRERRYRSNPDYFGQARDYTGDEGYQMSRMFDDGLGYDVIPEEPSNVSDGSDRSVGSVAGTNSDMGQPLNRQLDFDGGNKRKPKKKTKKKRKYSKKKVIDNF